MEAAAGKGGAAQRLITRMLIMSYATERLNP